MDVYDSWLLALSGSFADQRTGCCCRAARSRSCGQQQQPAPPGRRARYRVGRVDQLGESEFRSAVDASIPIQPAFRRLHVGYIPMEAVNRIDFGLLDDGLGARALGQAGDAVALHAAVQRRSRQRQDCRLKAGETIVQRQQRMLANGDDGRRFFDRKHGRLRINWTDCPGASVKSLDDRGSSHSTLNDASLKVGPMHIGTTAPQCGAPAFSP